MKQYSTAKKYAYLWITLILFVGSLVGHWVFAWFAFAQEQAAHSMPILFSDYFVEIVRDTLENWQSEFLQLIWQVAGLSFLWYVGSPQSKESDDRKEEKIDHILRAAYGQQADSILNELEEKYPRT